jgi:hypothetical protein
MGSTYEEVTDASVRKAAKQMVAENDESPPPPSISKTYNTIHSAWPFPF